MAVEKPHFMPTSVSALPSQVTSACTWAVVLVIWFAQTELKVMGSLTGTVSPVPPPDSFQVVL